MKTTIVSLFDDSRDLERAVNELNAGGFKERVFDAANVAQEVGHGTSSIFTPAAGPVPGGAGLAHGYADDSGEALARAFRDHLSDLHLPGDEIDSLVSSFRHGAMFVVVTTDPSRADAAIEILRNSNASRVERHG